MKNQKTIEMILQRKSDKLEELINETESWDFYFLASNISGELNRFNSLFTSVIGYPVTLSITRFYNDTTFDKELKSFRDLKEFFFGEFFSIEMLIESKDNSFKIFDDPPTFFSIVLLKTPARHFDLNRWDEAFCEHNETVGVGVGVE